MKIFNLLSCLLFILSAALQYNDSDPYLWVPIYLYGAWFCFQYFRGIYAPKAYLAGILIYSAYALLLFFDQTGVMSWYKDHEAENIVQSMKATKPWIEETREFGGLLILIVVLAINYLSLKHKKSHHN